MDPRNMKKDDLVREVGELRQRILKLEESSLQKDNLIQKNSLLANIIGSSDDAIFSSTVNGAIVSWNKGAERIYGYTAQEVFGCGVSMLAPPDRKDEMLKIQKKVTSGQRVDHLETVRLRKDGTPFHVSLAVSPILNTTREIVGICAIARDITERKRAENVLQESETKFRELFEHIHSCVAIYEAVNGGDDFVFTDFNTTAEKIEGISRKHVIGKSVRTVFPGVEEFGLFEVLKKVYKTGKPEGYPAALYNDQRISSWRENYVYKLPSGEIVAVYEDITERTEMDRKLQQAAIFQQRLIDALPVPVFYKDSEGRYMGCNSSFEKYFGQKREQIIGKSVYEISLKEIADIYHEKDQDLLRNQGLQVYESTVKDTDGVVHNVFFHKATFLNMDGSVGGLIGAILDITD
ncbi:MAG: hypothetical protein C0399_00005, partial [Syntrophus sp. (in: bacteria)]|nr:hypothetical protein [Syntrophus sp. (in: bacteria)]